MAFQNLPTRFPCWCRAVYSWGGETDKDLGFVEGDLIECLNAGDGSWWMGRLRRDRRIMGLFPSNFVTVLGDEFNPISRSVSPVPDMVRADSGKNSIANLEKKKEKAKSRRPFQGYKAAAPAPAKAEAQAPVIQQAPKQPTYNHSNPPSTVLWQQRPVSRGPSRSPSPMPHHDIGSSPPPPPPPPHRVVYGGNISRMPSPQPPRMPSPQPPRIPSPRFDMTRTPSPQPQMMDMNDRYLMISRTPSPAAQSLNGHTPPMIRDAMDSVMSSLHGMSMGRPEQEPDTREPFNPWSPEAFEDLHQNVTRHAPRPLTSHGFSNSANQFPEPRPSYSSRHNSPDRSIEEAPYLETYVERMEKQLRARAEARQGLSLQDGGSEPPEVPPKNSPWAATTSIARTMSIQRRKSAYEIGNGQLNRTYTTKTNSTNSSSGAQSNATSTSNQSSKTSQSLMSGYSAGGFSATSAGSLARRNHKQAYEATSGRPTTSAGARSERWGKDLDFRPTTPGTAISYHSSHDSRAGARSAVGWSESDRPTSSGGLGGFTTPKAKKSGLWKKLADGGKTAFASARSTIVPTSGASSQSGSPTKSSFNDGINSIAGGMALSSPVKDRRKTVTSNAAYGRDAAAEMGLGGGASNPWVMSRRDVNRSNTPGPSERQERAERCQMLNEPVIYPVEELYETLEGNESADGRPVLESFQLSNPSFSLVDKAARIITSLPSSITAATLATAHVCRPYRSDVQRLRAIFIWCAERISWDDDVDFDNFGEQHAFVDTRRVIQSRRGSNREVAQLIMEMCRSVGIHAEVVQGYLKTPGEMLDLDAASPAKAKHWWNAVLVDGEWRMIDASLASATHPQRAAYSGVSPSIAEAWYFLTKPSDMCWTHIPVAHEQQHIVPAASPDTLLALPVACPPFFRLGLGVHNYDTSLIRLEGLEVCTLSIDVPYDVEIVAEVEAKTYLQDQDGDYYDASDSVIKHRALSQPNWYQTTPNPDSLIKRYIIKSLLPGDEGNGILKIYAGKKGLMHSAREIVHPLALAVPLYHTGNNPPFEFVRRHPTIHATRQDLYLVQPQCFRLAAGETYVFCVRQHPANYIGTQTPQSEQNGFDFRPVSPNPLIRPGSALSMSSSVVGGSQQGSDSGSTAVAAGVRVKDKPAKLAIQSPGGKIIRLNRKHEGGTQNSAAKEMDGMLVGSMWESTVKVSERGVWRGLVLADRSARWCVWGEWECS